MDLRARRPYVGAAMEFLLILSAVLSAVTGAFTGTRAPEPQAAPLVAMVAPRAEQTVEAVRTRIPLATQARTAALPVLRTFALAAAIPLYADRLIE